MPVYTYTALDRLRAPQRGSVIADSPREVRDRLRAQGLLIQQVAPEKRRGSNSMPWNPWRNASSSRWVDACIRDLAMLTGVGLPVHEALKSMQASQTGSALMRTQSLFDAVATGQSLAKAMDGLPGRPFEQAVVQMVRAGEHAGRLPEVLEHIAAYREGRSQLRGKLVSALVYPVVILAVGTLVTLFLLMKVVPDLALTLEEAGAPLPALTEAVLALSAGLERYGLIVLIIAIGLVLLIARAIRIPRLRLALERGVLLVPLLGRLIREQHLARLSYVLSTLLRSGVSFEDGLSLGRDMTRNQTVRNALDRGLTAIREGRDIGPSLADARVFPPAVIRVLAVGQQSGRLDEVLDHLSAHAVRYVDQTSSRLTALLEPALIIAMAVAVGIIALAVILPILELGHAL